MALRMRAGEETAAFSKAFDHHESYSVLTSPVLEGPTGPATPTKASPVSSAVQNGDQSLWLVGCHGSGMEFGRHCWAPESWRWRAGRRESWGELGRPWGGESKGELADPRMGPAPALGENRSPGEELGVQPDQSEGGETSNLVGDGRGQTRPPGSFLASPPQIHPSLLSTYYLPGPRPCTGK